MSSTNNGKQVLTFDYAQEGTSQGFNKIMYKLIPNGIISGGDLTKVTDGTVAISTFLSFFEDTSNGVGVRLETTDTATVLVTETNNWIIGRFNWLNIEENYMDFLGVAWDNIQPTDIIFGKCMFSALGELKSFDMSRKSWSRNHYENFKSKYPNFFVLPNVPENDKVLVCKGNGYINGKKVELTSESTQTASFDLNVSNSRIDLVVINENSEIEIIKGVDDEDAKAPKCPINKLILARINLSSNPTSISGTSVENIYSINPYTNSELVDESVTTDKIANVSVTNEKLNVGDVGYTICSDGVNVTCKDFKYENGRVIKILYLNDVKNDNTFTTYINVNSLGNKKIYVNKHGEPIEKPCHMIVDENKYYSLKAYTILELMYLENLDDNNGGFIIMGNPEVVSGSSEDGSASYSVKANGLIEQWGCYTKSVKDTTAILNFPVVMPNVNYSVMITPSRSSSTSGYPFHLNGRANKTANSFKVITNGEYNEGFDWLIKD